MQKTPIEYLDMTWNPIAMRCTPVSAGCDHCWHLRTAHRMAVNLAITKRRRDAYSGGGAWLDPNEISAPLRRKKPAVIGVNFMGDLFHESITNELIAAVFGVMAASPQHQYCVLTKRVERAAEFYRIVLPSLIFQCAEKFGVDGSRLPHVVRWPLPNVMLGVSVEGPKYLGRVDNLRHVPASKRFISLEPLLAPMPNLDLSGIDQVIVGAETGPGKRPMELDWARSVRDQCQAAGVPFFFKVDSNGNRELDGKMWEEVPW